MRTDRRKDIQTDRRTDRHGETNGRFSQFSERALKQLFSNELQDCSNFNRPHIIEVSQTVINVIFNSYTSHCTKLLN